MHEDKTQSGGNVLDAKSQQEKIDALAIAYHNLAIELEFNYRSDVSLEVFIIMYPVLIFFHFLILFSL
jgi:hypothetical protein